MAFEDFSDRFDNMRTIYGNSNQITFLSRSCETLTENYDVKIVHSTNISG